MDKQTKTERVHIATDADWIRRVDVWRGAQQPIPSRSTAIRRLVDQALEHPRAQEPKR